LTTLINKLGKKILDIDDDIVESHIFFSENGLYLMKYVGGKLCIANIETEKTKIIVLSNQLCKTIIPSTFAISDNGELITVLNNNDVIMINDNSQIDKCNIDEQFGNLKDITLNIIDSSDNKNKINVITLWNKKLHKILLITLICNNGHILTKKYLNFKINDELDIVYTNGHEYVYKFDEYIDVYSIDKIISLNNLDSLLDILLINLDKFGTQNVQLLIIGPKRQNICNVKKWLVNMAGGLQQVDLSKHSELVDIVVLKNKKGTDMNLVQIFLALMHNHKLINDYLNCIASDGLYEDKIESIILSFLKFAKILISLCKNDTIINLFEYYIDYLLIKIATVVYVHETDIELIINIFKNIKNTKEFMVSMFKINFELDLMSYG